MAGQAEFKVVLTIDSQGNAKIEEVKKSLEGVGNAAQNANQKTSSGAGEANAHLQNTCNLLDRQTAAWLSVAGASYVAYRGFNAWFSLVSAGVDAVGDYQNSIYGAAAALTYMTQASIPKDEAYSQWKAYFDWLWRASAEADQKFAASGREIYETASEFAKRGAIARTRAEVESIANITDTIKSLTKGMHQPMAQINQEIRSLFEGRIAAGSQLALELQKLDVNFKENFQTAVKTNTVLQYLDSLLPRIAAKTKDISNTWESVYSSLTMVKGEVLREAFGPGYADIVRMGAEIRDLLYQDGELTEKGRASALALGNAWAAAKPKVEGLLDYILNNSDECIAKVGTIANAVGTIGGAAATAIIFVADLVNALDKAANSPFWQMVGGAALGSRFGPIGAVIGAIPGAANYLKDAGDFGFGAMLPDIPGAGESFDGYESPLLQSLYGRGKGSGKAPPTPGVRPPGGMDKSGGGGGEGALNSMKSLMDRLNQDIARLSEGSLAAVDAWYDKTVKDINKLVAKGLEGEKALELAAKAKILKKEKIEQDFYSWAAKESGDHYTDIVADTNKWLLAVGQNAGMATKIMEIHFERTRKQQKKDTIEGLSLQKSQLDSLAGAMPFLDQQLAVKGRILPLEAEINRLTLEQKLRTLEIPDALKDELRGYAALTAEAKRFNLEMEKNKGLSGWAWSRAKEADQRNTVKDMMGGLESGFQNAFSSGLQGVLSQDKKSLQNIGKTMWQGFLGEIHKGGITRVFDSAAKMLAPSPKGGAGTDLTAAGQILNTAGLQLVTSAGGLLLSGIGIATNSQDLVIAGTVLQMAGLAIQVYQMITAGTLTGAAGALTGAAGALTAAAVALQFAAAVDAATFWHSGGVVAHAGWLVAHDGLNLDERRVIAQTGEGIIQRRTMEEYARQGITFDMLNSGRLPVAPAPVAVPMAREAGPSGGNANGGSVVNIGDVHLHIYESEMTAQKADLLVRRHVMPALNRELGRYGVKLGK